MNKYQMLKKGVRSVKFVISEFHLQELHPVVLFYEIPLFVPVSTQQLSKLTHTSPCNNEFIGLVVLQNATCFGS
jgi:hypothetical protein